MPKIARSCWIFLLVAGLSGCAPGTTATFGTGGAAAAGPGAGTGGGGGGPSTGGAAATPGSGGRGTGGVAGSGGNGGSGGVSGGSGGSGGMTGTSGGSTGSSSGGATGGTSSGGAGGRVGTGGRASGGAGVPATGGRGGASTGGASASGGAGGAFTAPFILGADISFVPEREAAGRRFRDNGVQKDVVQILKDHGFNFIRLRTFHNPRATGGYSAAGFCDLANTIQMGKRVKDLGLGLLLDFHYSDNWADPGKQVKPAAWTNLSFAALTTAVHDYTKDAITQMIAGGARPDMVQVGNEITPGMLLPDGSSANANWDNLATLLKAGIAGVKEVDAGIKIMLHIDRGGDNVASRWWVDSALARGVAFDVLGQSCYTVYQGPPSGWQANFTDLVTRYPNLSFAVAEYSLSKREANDIMFNLPGKKGLGTFIWEPTDWMERIFDAQGNTIPAMIGLYDQMATAYGLR